MIRAPNMLMVGSSGRNTGKTDLACALAARFGAGRPLLAVKVTTVQDRNNVCPRGGKGCGVCTSLEDTHSIVEEKNAGNRKDTERLLAAGAQKVLWLRVMKEHLREGASALLECIGPESLTICESNSLRTVVEPAVFLMVQGSDQMEWKASAEAVREYVDRHVTFNGDRFDLDPDDVGIVDGSWAVRLEASAVILAGGRGARMGRDKGSLPVGKRTMLEHIAAQLAPHFEQLLVSTSGPADSALPRAKVVVDRVSGQGPLMGIASTLEASPHDFNLFVACDIPDIDMAFVRRLLRAARGHDAAVPVTPDGRLEPLLAVYREGFLGPAREALDAGKRRVRDAFDACTVNYVPLEDVDWLRNLNTPEEYAAFLAQGAAKNRENR